MEWIEVTGKTLDEARERALDELGVHQSELEYEVIDEAKGGLFGRFGRVEARIRARVKPVSRDKPNDRRRRRGGSETRGPRGGRESSGGRTRRSGGQGADRESRAPQAEKPARESTGTGPAAGGGSGAPRKRRRSRSPRKPEAVTEQGRERPGRPENTDEPGGSRRREQGVAVSESTVPIEEQAAAAEEFTAGMIEAFGLGARVSAVVADDAVEVNVEGEDLGLLVGPKGATLAAIEELVRAAMSRSTGGHSARVHVDVAGYRRRRREALAAFVRGVAEEVLASGETKAMEPMPPADRKVIHDTVAEIDGVGTTSEGEDLRRHVVISPT